MWLELGLVPLMGKATSRSVSGGDYVLKRTLCCLFVDGWGSVLFLLLVWHNASLHWSLWALGWGHSQWQKGDLLKFSHL